MESYTGRRTLFGNLVNNSASTTLTIGDTLMNDSEKRLMSMKDWPWLWRQYTLTTTAGTSSYVLPAYTSKPQSLYVTVGSYRYTPIEVTNRIDWDRKKAVAVSSDIVTHCFYYDGAVELFPTPSTTSNVITFNARRIAKDLSIADYVTGNIVSIANGASAVVGSGTSWTSQMAGRFIRITDSDTANTGDGFWYEIASVGSATTLTLTRKYGGTSISAGSAAYTIGQCSLIPEPFNQIPVFEALGIYFTSIDPNQPKAQLYSGKAKELLDQMFKEYTSKANVVLDDGRRRPFVNPNLTITL